MFGGFEKKLVSGELCLEVYFDLPPAVASFLGHGCLSRSRMQIASTTLLFDGEEAGIPADKKQLQ